MARLLAQLLQLFTGAVFALLLSSCGSGSGSQSAIKAFASKIYSTMDRKEEIRIISGTEIEFSKHEGNFVGSYTREGNKIRVVFEVLGTKHSDYFIETDDGLTAEETGKAYLSEAGLKKSEEDRQATLKKTEEDRQARLKKTEEDIQAAKTQFARLAKEKTLDLGNGVKMELVLIPAGKFMMGSPVGEKGHQENEGPQHEVMITKLFYMGKYAVTQEQYEAVMGQNPSHFIGSKNPVEEVSWDDAQAFCKKLSGQTTDRVRLPTEAEWEYSCRAGTRTAYYSGDTDKDLDRVAWYGANSKGTTHPVGQKEANAFKLYDLHGNVWQWCQDIYGEDYYGKSEAENPQGPSQGMDFPDVADKAVRLLRGGSWGNNPMNYRSAYRYRYDPGLRSLNVGFRVVVVPAFRTP